MRASVVERIDVPGPSGWQIRIERRRAYPGSSDWFFKVAADDRGDGRVRAITADTLVDARVKAGRLKALLAKEDQPE